MPEPITQQDRIAQALIDRITYLEKENRRLKKVRSSNERWIRNEWKEKRENGTRDIRLVY